MSIIHLKTILVFVLLLLIGGCQSELYSGLTEKEGNEMLALLLENGVSASREIDKDKNVTLLVDSSQVSDAINLLKSYGYPKERFVSMGDIFTKEGMISSPTEERARYMYSMSQELSATLSMVDGVVSARVHVVLPQNGDKLSQTAYPSSAAVFIKFTNELDLTGFEPKVKTLIANSIEGLSLDKITVSLFPATRITSEDQIISKKTNSSMLWVVIVVGVLFILVACVLFILIRKNKIKLGRGLPKNK